jgi:predicted secreted Zn-dependent protease
MKHNLLVSLCVCLVLATSCNPELETRAAGSPITASTSAPTVSESIDMPNATVVYYDISGSNESELRAQLDALGPVGYDGYKGDATTTWSIGWNWPGHGSDICNLGAVTVSYTIQVIMPRWRPPENASADLVARWANFIHALVEHEQGHVDLVVANYRSVEEAIKAATCETAQAAAQAALIPIRQQDVDYDAATQHGATQGARFP